MKKVSIAAGMAVLLLFGTLVLHRSRGGGLPASDGTESLRDAPNEPGVGKSLAELKADFQEANAGLERSKGTPAWGEAVDKYRRALADLLARQNSCRELAKRPQPREQAFSLQVNDARPVPVRLWIADTDETEQSGLMCRKKLEDGRGMLFLAASEAGQGGVWMYQCSLPLSVLFLDKGGLIVDKVFMKPCLRPRGATNLEWYARCESQAYHPKVAYDRMLELSPGYDKALGGLKTGDRLALTPD